MMMMMMSNYTYQKMMIVSIYQPAFLPREWCWLTLPQDVLIVPQDILIIPRSPPFIAHALTVDPNKVYLRECVVIIMCFSSSAN